MKILNAGSWVRSLIVGIYSTYSSMNPHQWVYWLSWRSQTAFFNLVVILHKSCFFFLLFCILKPLATRGYSMSPLSFLRQAFCLSILLSAVRPAQTDSQSSELVCVCVSDCPGFFLFFFCFFYYYLFFFFIFSRFTQLPSAFVRSPVLVVTFRLPNLFSFFFFPVHSLTRPPSVLPSRSHPNDTRRHREWKRWAGLGWAVTDEGWKDWVGLCAKTCLGFRGDGLGFARVG